MLLNDNNNLIKKVTFFYDSKNTNMAGPPSSQSEAQSSVMDLNMVQNVSANNVFKKFTGNTSQRNWSVVFSQNSVAFLENWCNVSQRPAVMFCHHYKLFFQFLPDP